MVLFLHQDVPQAFGDGELVQFIGLLDAAAVMADRDFLVLEIEAKDKKPEHLSKAATLVDEAVKRLESKTKLK